MNKGEQRWTKMNKWKDRKTSRHKDTNTQRGKDKKTKRFFWSISSQVPLASQGQDKTGKSTIYIVRRGNSVGWWWWQGRRLASGPINVTAVIQTLFHSPTTLLLPNCTQLDETARNCTSTEMPYTLYKLLYRITYLQIVWPDHFLFLQFDELDLTLF